VSESPEDENFANLSEAEQREIAERLIRIAESGWKPFWCADPTCDGMPHWMLDENGNCLFVSEYDTQGPVGQPVGDRCYEDEDGEWVQIEDHETPEEVWSPLGRPILDPNWAHNHAREDQRLPSWLKPWTLFIMSGRGSGKTRTGVEFVTLCARKGLNGAILGRRGTELVNTHVAEILAHAHPEFVPIHWASKDILEWPNGAITYLFSAEKPENIRSVNLSYAWVDEAAFMDEINTAWMNLKMATRIETPGNPIHFLITSTPTGSEWVQKMEDDPDVIVRRVSTYANRANLSKSFLADLEKEYEGTRMGRQELHGEVLRDVEGALWNDDLFKHERCDTYEQFAAWLESMDDRVLAVDPAGSANKRSDLTGIIGMGAQHFDDTGSPLPASTFTMLGDATIKGTPSEWAERVYSAARLMRVNRIIAEKNFGGDMVKQVLQDWAKLHPELACDENGEDFKIEVVHAQQSKETRAEATVGKYEQGRVTHLTSKTAYGDLSAVEKEMVLWVPKSRGGRQPSPNRIDATVWAVRALESKIRFAAQQATSRDVMTKLKRTANVSGNRPPIATRRQMGGRRVRQFPIRRKPAA
jgi:phage terminase large subunit-like protein